MPKETPGLCRGGRIDGAGRKLADQKVPRDDNVAPQASISLPLSSEERARRLAAERLGKGHDEAGGR